jgi:hypothetical protein
LKKSAEKNNFHPKGLDLNFWFFNKSWGKLRFTRLSVGQQSKTDAKLSVPNIKVWSTFSKVVGVGNAHKCFMLSQILIAKRLSVWRIEYIGESLKMRQQRKEKPRY